MDPEHCSSTRDKAYDISTMKENKASSSEEAALRRLLSTPEAGMWTEDLPHCHVLPATSHTMQFFVRRLRPVMFS